MNPIWLIRMSRWARNPPSWGRIKLVAGVVIAALALGYVEYVWGWPEWLTVEKLPRHP